MSIQNQLKSELQQYAGQMTFPRELDGRVERVFNAYAAKKQRRTFLRDSKRARIALIAACILLFSGVAYASNLLYTMQTNKVQLEVSKNAAVQLPDSLNEQIRGTFREVRSQLSPGEAAVVYVQPLEQRKLPAVTMLVHPAAYTDIQHWKQQVEQAGTQLKTPTVLPQGFYYVRGELQPLVGMLDAESYAKYEKKLKQQAKETKQTIVWQKAEAPSISADGFYSPGLIYANTHNDEIEVRYQLLPASEEHMDLKLTTGDKTTGEKVSVAGKEGYYTVNPQSIFTDNGAARDVSWMDSVDGRTILYHVMTSSANVTKDELLAVANSLK
ncbi:hypothetical protein [Paenibacillus sp. UNC451MF]|uniref:hypothetical protein n=1 Tax=Paenibacillus sp. UNC451MF TaxID=1449063 RepID=UPI00048F8099|nr:hypothetical protein [Paenibacillus sp. UNC451MF]